MFHTGFLQPLMFLTVPGIKLNCALNFEAQVFALFHSMLLLQFIASLMSSGFCPCRGLPTPISCCYIYNSQVSASDHESTTVESAIASSITQKVLSEKVEEQLFKSLLESSFPANKARLLSVSAPHAASWLSVILESNEAPFCP